MGPGAEESHELLTACLSALQEVTGLPGLYPDDGWYVQMGSSPLPAAVDVVSLHTRLHGEHQVEVPVVVWNDRKLLRISVQAYNDEADIQRLTTALKRLL